MVRLVNLILQVQEAYLDDLVYPPTLAHWTRIAYLVRNVPFSLELQVHEAYLDDLVYPTEIVGKRIRYR